MRFNRAVVAFGSRLGRFRRAAESLLTTFEYLAIAYSLLFSATALRIVGGMPHVFRRGSIYWVHAAAVVVLLIGTVQNFWTFLAYRDVQWTYIRFISMLAIPGNLYFIASMLIPDDPQLIDSWERHYFERRIQYFSGVVGWGVLALLNTTFVLGMSLTHPARAVQIGMVAVGLGGLMSNRRIVHQVLIGVALLLILAMGLVVVLFPDGIG